MPNRDSSNLWSASIDPSTLELHGEPIRLTHLSGYNPKDLVVSGDGTRLGFLLEHFQIDVYVSELESQGAGFASTRRLTLDDRDDRPSGWLSDSARFCSTPIEQVRTIRIVSTWMTSCP